MRETKYYCDRCRKEMPEDKIYYVLGVGHRCGIVTKPNPASVEVCSTNCMKEWISNVLESKE